MELVMDLPDEAAELFRVPPEDFIAERDALVQRLRAEGRDEDATAVKALRKPTTVVWALNQLATREPDALAAVFEAGREPPGRPAGGACGQAVGRGGPADRRLGASRRGRTGARCGGRDPGCIRPSGRRAGGHDRGGVGDGIDRHGGGCGARVGNPREGAVVGRRPGLRGAADDDRPSRRPGDNVDAPARHGASTKGTRGGADPCPQPPGRRRPARAAAGRRARTGDERSSAITPRRKPRHWRQRPRQNARSAIWRTELRPRGAGAA